MIFTSGLVAASLAIAVPLVEEPIAIDGALDEPAWAGAAVIEDFVTVRPTEGAAPSHPLRVRIFRDERRLYVGFEAFDPDPGGVRATLSDRDDIFDDDFAGIVLDPFRDQRRAFLFFANPLGVQADCVNVDGGRGDDCTWDAVYSSAGRVTATGYTIEMAIPFSGIRFDRENDEWGFGVTRTTKRNGEQVAFPAIRDSLGSFHRQLAVLTGMRGIPVRAAYEVIPELTVRSGAGDATDADAGITAKVARAGVAIDAAFNPDFSQVESDAARIAFNERFSLYYREKRPFFLEGRELFVTPWEVVYTRSIVDPQYGVKLSGKSGATSFALLHALDETPAPSVLDETHWSPDTYRGKPAVTSIARVATDLSSRATVGLLATDKQVNGGWNSVAGVDGSLQATERIRIASHVMWSSTEHPDDGGAVSGSVAKIRFMRSGRRFDWFSWYEQVSPGFRAEVGFMPRASYREVGLQPAWRFETGAKTGLLAVNVEPVVRVLDDVETTDAERQAMLGVELETASGFARPSVVLDREVFRDERFEYARYAIEGYAAPERWLSVFAFTQLGHRPAYFEGEPYLGAISNTTLELGLRPSKRVTLAAEWTRRVFGSGGTEDVLAQVADRGGEDIVFDATVSRFSAQIFFTQAISVRAIADWDGVSDQVHPSALLAWRPGPGTVVYAGWQDSYVTESGVEPLEDARVGFLKLSYLFGIY